MSDAVVTILIAVASLALFGGCFAAALLATRPARPRPAPPTPDLSDEPPAVVNLVGNGWELNEDAVEATLLDLAARRHIELRQPGSDPRQTTVHLRDTSDAQPGNLTDYEGRVLDRVRGLAVGGVVPISALTFRNEDQEKGWEKRFRTEVIADAKARGLTRRRFDGPVVSLLEIVAAVAAIGLAVATAHWESWAEFDEDSQGAWVWVGFMAFVVLGASVAGVNGQRHTPAGVAAAQRWGGVRAWLHGHEEFAQLPPASVMVWDRYLAYGAALGVTRVASEVLDLGMADRKRVWSSYGGGWHRVRVRYPWRRATSGLTSGAVFKGGLIRVAFGVGLLWLRSEFLPQLGLDELFGRASVQGVSLADGERVLGYVMLVLGVYLLARGGYRLLRGAIDLGSTRTITGELLWLEPWLTRKVSEDGPRVPVLHYLAIDDGSSDKTTAWGLPPELHSDVATGDTVTVQVRPWTRRVIHLRSIARGNAHRLADQLAREEYAEEAAARMTSTPRLDAATLLTADEIGQALGMPVTKMPPAHTPMASMATYADQRGQPVLMVQVTGGAPARWIWRAHAKRGTELLGIGHDARGRGEQVVARVGEHTVALVAMNGGKRAEASLPGLLRQAVARIPAEAALPSSD
jgi:hypothetical protein